MPSINNRNEWEDTGHVISIEEVRRNSAFLRTKVLTNESICINRPPFNELPLSIVTVTFRVLKTRKSNSPQVIFILIILKVGKTGWGYNILRLVVYPISFDPTPICVAEVLSDLSVQPR
jgi:hypothetical protein